MTEAAVVQARNCSSSLLSGAEIQGRLHPAQASLGYLLARFQCLQAEIPLAPKSHAFTEMRSEFFISPYFDPD
jgi:hypothetical protein